MKLRNKVVVVTGAASGMGRELTTQLVQKGARVAMVDIHEETLAETAKLAGADQVSQHLLNITDRQRVEDLPDGIVSEHGQIDALVNNAGIIQPFVDIKDLDYPTIERVVNINFYGTIYMTKAFLPYFLKRPEAHIANVSSMGGFIPFPGQTVYSASKAAVKIFTVGLYSELKDTNVGVTVIHPGAVQTNIMENSGLEAPKDSGASSGIKALPADRAATIMIDAVEKNKFRVMVGKDARMMDYFYRFSPKRAVDMIVNKMGSVKNSIRLSFGLYKLNTLVVSSAQAY